MFRFIALSIASIAVFVLGWKTLSASPTFGVPEVLACYTKDHGKEIKAEVESVQAIASTTPYDTSFRRVTYLVTYNFLGTDKPLKDKEKVFITYQLIGDNMEKVVQMSYYDKQGNLIPKYY